MCGRWQINKTFHARVRARESESAHVKRLSEEVLHSILIKTSRSIEQINFLYSRLLGFLHYLSIR